eukprot:12029627-Alexandrium_andersonii.AAC.1
MADTVNLVAEPSLLPEVLVAGRGASAPAAADPAAAGPAATPFGRWSAPGLPAGSGGLQPGMLGTWLLMFGPPYV